MQPASYTNTYHDIKNLVNHGIVIKLKNLNILRTEHKFAMKQKKFNLCLRWHILRSYHSVAEVTFKCRSCSVETF